MKRVGREVSFYQESYLIWEPESSLMTACLLGVYESVSLSVALALWANKSHSSGFKMNCILGGQSKALILRMSGRKSILDTHTVPKYYQK